MKKLSIIFGSIVILMLSGCADTIDESIKKCTNTGEQYAVCLCLVSPESAYNLSDCAKLRK